MSDALLLICIAIVAVWSIETIDAFTAGDEVNALLAPVTIARNHLASSMPDTSLGSPRWSVAAALLLPALALAAISLLPLASSFRGGDAAIGVFLFIMLLDFIAVIVATIGWSANRVTGVTALFGAVLQLVAHGIIVGSGRSGP